MEDSKPPPPLPRIIDLHGQLRDPYTGNPLEEGQEGPGSIFHAASSSSKEPEYQLFTGKDTTIPFSQFMDQLRAAGFEGENVIMHVTPRPEDVDRVPSPPPEVRNYSGSGFEFSTGNPYRTNCNYCWAVTQGKEREAGFKLSEIQKAASGCSTCTVLNAGITKFANLIFSDYNSEKVRVRQKYDRKIRTLSDTKAVRISFDQYGGETILLTFSGSTGHSRNEEYVDDRIMETSSYSTIMLIQEWLTTCSEQHYQCAIPPVSVLPKRVLDVSNSKAKLIETNGKIAPYITLSHCWGHKPVIRLLRSNIEDLRRDIPWNRLSKTFQDAIAITWKLGFRYLWIDALCILQDSVRDWEFHAAKMAPIFSNSQLTISASSGADGSKGCFSSRVNEPYTLHSHDSREIRNKVLWVPYYFEGMDRDGCHKTFTVRLKTPHGLYQNRRPKEPLLKRAWVFQEQILSPRIVHFASGELYFECKSHVACECSGWNLRSSSYQWETRWRKAHSFLLGQRIDSSHASETKIMKQKEGEFEAYRALIETYTELDITAEQDRLPALSGITFGRKDEYLAGMWRSLLLESLHWYPVSKSLRNIMARRPFQYRAPTWSWASIESPIRHVEKEFYKYMHSAKYVSKIIDASATAMGLDPRGKVTGGYLRIQGPMGEAKVVSIGVCEREGSESEESQKRMASTNQGHIDPSLQRAEKIIDLCTYATLRRDGKEGRCYLDLPLALCRTDPAEVSLGDEVMCLVVSTTTIIVLRQVKEIPASHTRVGYFRPKDAGWLFDKDRNSIFIR